MSFKEFFEKEKQVVLYGQSFRFRIIKYTIIAMIAVLIYIWRGLSFLILTFVITMIVAIFLHFFFRWKTKGWTTSWWLYKKNNNRVQLLLIMYYVYILECSDKSLYVGWTNNLEKRIYSHNHAKSGAHYTKIRRPVKLKYFKKFRLLSKSRKRENEIKSWTRKKKLELIKNKII